MGAGTGKNEAQNCQIPSSVASIGYSVFSDCSSLTQITKKIININIYRII